MNYYNNNRYYRKRYYGRGYNRGYRQSYNPQGREFKGVQDLKPTDATTTAGTENKFVKASLTVGQVEFIKRVLTFVKDSSTITPLEVGATEEGLKVAHAVLTVLYGNTANNNIPTKDQWREFYKWLATFNQ